MNWLLTELLVMWRQQIDKAIEFKGDWLYTIRPVQPRWLWPQDSRFEERRNTVRIQRRAVVLTVINFVLTCMMNAYTGYVF